MGEYRKVRNIMCSNCNGSGKTKMRNLETLENCLHCEGDGYRVIYEDGDGCQRHVTVSDHKMGIIKPYFPFKSD